MSKMVTGGWQRAAASPLLDPPCSSSSECVRRDPDSPPSQQISRHTLPQLCFLNSLFPPISSFSFHFISFHFPSARARRQVVIEAGPSTGIPRTIENPVLEVSCRHPRSFRCAPLLPQTPLLPRHEFSAFFPIAERQNQTRRKGTTRAEVTKSAGFNSA